MRLAPSCSGNILLVTEVTLSFADDTVRAVGVSHYQDALTRICPRSEGERTRCRVRAGLVPEPGNPHDPNAVMVRIGDDLVGYLSRGDAERYGPAVRLLADHGRHLVCDAVVGGRGGDAGTTNLGVFLSLPGPVEAELEAQTLVRA